MAHGYQLGIADLDTINVYVYDARVGEVFDAGKFSVHVYREVGERHHLPHCQVRWSDGPPSSQVALPTLVVLAGRPLSRQVRELLADRLEEIWAEWVRLNS